MALGDFESIQVGIVRKWKSFSRQRAGGGGRCRLQESSSASFHGGPPRRLIEGAYTTTERGGSRRATLSIENQQLAMKWETPQERPTSN
jgi:hypothetical protein